MTVCTDNVCMEEGGADFNHECAIWLALTSVILTSFQKFQMKEYRITVD